MTFKKKRRSIFWHVEQRLDDVAMWHKRRIRDVRKQFNLTDYKLLWVAFGKGFILGLLIL